LPLARFSEEKDPSLARDPRPMVSPQRWEGWRRAAKFRPKLVDIFSLSLLKPLQAAALRRAEPQAAPPLLLPVFHQNVFSWSIGFRQSPKEAASDHSYTMQLSNVLRPLNTRRWYLPQSLRRSGLRLGMDSFSRWNGKMVAIPPI